MTGNHRGTPATMSAFGLLLPAGNQHNGGNMGDLVNLKQFRKRAAREQSEQQAAANRSRFGRTRAERKRDELRASRADSLLDQHRIDSEDGT